MKRVGRHRDPRIAVLIPVYNEEPVIAGTIDALVAADCARSDIYIVNDCSTDRTAEIASKLGVSVYTVPENGGKARAQVQALAYFQLCERYDWVIFLDGDTKVDLYFINAMFKAANEDPTVALYVGQVKSVANNHVFSATRAVEYAYGQDIAKQGQSNFNVIFVSPGCASMYKSQVLRKMHIDHKTLAEDMDLTMQIHRAGEKVKYLADAIVYTQDPATLKDYYKQNLRWFRGFWQVVLKHNILSWGRKQWVDLYMILLMVDATIFNRVIWLAGLMIAFPERIMQIAMVDILVMFAVTVYGAWRTKRFDVIKKFPLSYPLGFVAIAGYFQAFVEIVVLKKELLAWNKVARYEYNDPTTTVSTT